MKTAPVAVRLWADDLLSQLPEHNANRELVRRLVADERMLDVWRNLASATVDARWYRDERIATFVESCHMPGDGDAAREREALLKPQALAMVRFAQACFLARGFHADIQPAKPAAEIREDWATIGRNSAEAARKLRALRVVSATANDLAFVLSSLLRRYGVEEEEISQIAGGLRNVTASASQERPDGVPGELRTSDLLEEIARIARANQPLETGGPRKRTPEVMRRTIVIRELCNFANRVYESPSAKLLAEAAEVVLDDKAPIDARQVREVLNSIRGHG